MNYKIKPWEHQLQAIERAAPLPGYALFFEVGAGKSGTCINILRHRNNWAGRILRTIIFCPPLVIPNWKNEWKLHSNIDTKKVIPLYGSGKKRLATFYKYAYSQGTSFSAGDSEDCVFITNYESLLMPDLYEAFLKWEPEALVYDESHKCKSITAQRSKLANALANPFDQAKRSPLPKPLTYILSGSPILKNPMDIFMQFLILDGGESFGHNFWAFRGRYFRDRNAGMPKDRYFPKWEMMTIGRDGFDAFTEIKNKILAKGMVIEKEDCMDLPEEVSVVVKVPMSAEQERLYKELKKDLVTYYKSKACVASLAITKALRLLQITSGFIAAETPGEAEGSVEIAIADTPKYDALVQLLADLIEQGQKVIVWTVWRFTYKEIARACEEVSKLTKIKFSYVEIHGDISEKKKRENVEKFKTDNECRVFIGHPGSGGIGINLTVAGCDITYSRNRSLEYWIQARGRNHRGGAKEAGHKKITHYDLVCEGTLDEATVKILQEQEKMADSMLGKSHSGVSLEEMMAELENETNPPKET